MTHLLSFGFLRVRCQNRTEHIRQNRIKPLVYVKLSERIIALHKHDGIKHV